MELYKSRNELLCSTSTEDEFYIEENSLVLVFDRYLYEHNNEYDILPVVERYMVELYSFESSKYGKAKFLSKRHFENCTFGPFV